MRTKLSRPKKTQAGFRADETLLRRFKSRVKLHGHTMGEVIEMLIDEYLARDNEQTLSSEERVLIDDLRAIIRTGGEVGHALNCILRELRQAAEKRGTGK